MINIAGASAALSAAVLWAFSSILIEDAANKVSPVKMNFYKGMIALVLLFLTSLILGESLSKINWSEISVLLLSGLIGIGIGDTAYFQAVQKIGARRALMLFALSPPMAALIALIFLGEQLPLLTWIGIMVTAGGVMWVVTEESDEKNTKISRKDLAPGILFGALAALCQAAGVVMTRSVLTQTNLTSLQSTIVRLVAAIISLLIIMRLMKSGSEKAKSASMDRKLASLIFFTSFIGAYICLWLQQIAIENVPAGIAQTMLSTSPIFILPMSAMRGEKISTRAIIGAMLAIVGVTLIFGLIR